MNLLKRLQLASASAADHLKEIAERAGTAAKVSIVISHPGTVEDAFLVGEHEPSELFEIIARIENGERSERDVTSTDVGPLERFGKGTVQ